MRALIVLLSLCVAFSTASAQPKIPLRQAVGWQVVPEQRIVNLGERMVFLLEVRNNGVAPLELRFSSGQQYDVWVYREGEWKERWRWGEGKAFTLAFTSLQLKPREVRQFRVEWDQRDSNGRQVPSGRYRVEAVLPALNPQGWRDEIKAVAWFTIRSAGRRNAVRVRDLIASPGRWVGQHVILEGRNEGWKPDPNCPICAGGPPVTRSDWVLRDDTGCIYVTGVYAPISTRGQVVTVEGIIRRNSKGQIYMEGRR